MTFEEQIEMKFVRRRYDEIILRYTKQILELLPVAANRPEIERQLMNALNLPEMDDVKADLVTLYNHLYLSQQKSPQSD